MDNQTTDPAGRHAPEIRRPAGRPVSNCGMTATHGNQPQGEQPVPEQAGSRPWPAPGTDAGWWYGEAPSGVPVTPAPAPAPAGRRPAPARHRGRRALPAPSEAPTAVLVVPAPPPVPHAVWEPDDRDDWAMRIMRAGRRPRALAAAPPRRVRPPRATRRPLPGLAALVLLGLLGAFFAWFSSEPLWLSLGHGTTGTATVRTCRVHGVATTCADFTANGDAFLATGVPLLGSGPVATGAKVPARMVSATGSAAYTGSAPPRWVPSLLAVLLCGFGIAWLTGGYRLPGRRTRLYALLLSLASPLLVTAGMLAFTW